MFQESPLPSYVFWEWVASSYINWAILFDPNKIMFNFSLCVFFFSGIITKHCRLEGQDRVLGYLLFIRLSPRLQTVDLETRLRALWNCFCMGTVPVCEMLPLMTKEHSKARPPNTIPSGIHGIHTPQSFTVCSFFIASQCLLMFLSLLGYLWHLFLVFLSISS